MGVELEGLAEFKQALLNLPRDLQSAAAAIVNDEADAAASEIRAQYERVKTPVVMRGYKRDGGHLSDHVTVISSAEDGSFARAKVKSSAPHAAIYEFGTGPRTTKKGVNHGSSPAHPTVIPVAIRRRRGMVDRIMSAIKAQGLEVSGE